MPGQPDSAGQIFTILSEGSPSNKPVSKPFWRKAIIRECTGTVI